MSEPAAEPATSTSTASGGSEAEGFTDSEVSQIRGIVEDVVHRLVPTSREDSRDRVERRLDRPSTIEDQVRAELGRAQREQAERDQAERDKGERETLAGRVAKLEEAPPAPPVRRSTKFLGWGDGR